MAQEYNKYGDSSYSTYPTDDKKYECRTGPFEGFFVGSVEFCKFNKFDDKDDRKITIEQEPKVHLVHKAHLVKQVHLVQKVHKVYKVYKVYKVNEDLTEHKVNKEFREFKVDKVYLVLR